MQVVCILLLNSYNVACMCSNVVLNGLGCLPRLNVCNEVLLYFDVVN